MGLPRRGADFVLENAEGTRIQLDLVAGLYPAILVQAAALEISSGAEKISRKHRLALRRVRQHHGEVPVGLESVRTAPLLAVDARDERGDLSRRAFVGRDE